jgi:hypothetical protein
MTPIFQTAHDKLKIDSRAICMRSDNRLGGSASIASNPATRELCIRRKNPCGQRPIRDAFLPRVFGKHIQNNNIHKLIINQRKRPQAGVSAEILSRYSRAGGKQMVESKVRS